MINFGVVDLSENWDFGHQVMYAQSSYKGDKEDHKFANVVMRPIYNWSETMKTEFEAGYYTEENQWGNDGADNEGTKFTVAQAWSAGSGFWARPEIRVYASYVDDFKTTTALATTNQMKYRLVSKLKHGGNAIALM